MSTEAHTEIIVRPVRDVDAEALGRVHAQCWLTMPDGQRKRAIA